MSVGPLMLQGHPALKVSPSPGSESTNLSGVQGLKQLEIREVRQTPWLQKKTPLLYPKAAVPGAAGTQVSRFFLFNLIKAGTWSG